MTKNKKKFLGIFAILFALLFAVGLVFGAACKKDKDEEEEEPTHTHSYTAGTWEWNDDYTACTTTAICTSTTGECDAKTVTWEAIVTSVATTETCVDAGYTTYTATYNGSTVATEKVAGKDATGVHTYTDKNKVEFTWTEDETEGYKVSATISCAVCGSTPVAMEVKVEGPANNEFYGTYTATATYGDVTATATKELVDPNAGGTQDPNAPSIDETKVVLNQKVDFSDPTSYTWLTFDASGTLTNDASYTDGVLTFVAQTAKNTNNKATLDTTEGRMKTGGSASTDNGRYFIINLSDYIGDVVEIEIVMRTNASGDNGTTTLYLMDNLNTPNASTNPGLASVTSVKTDSDDQFTQTLTYVEEITEANAVLYTICDANMHYYSVSVRASGDVKPSEGTTEPGSETPVYSIVVDGATDNTLALTIADGEEGEADVYGSATVSLQKDGETVEGTEAKFEVTSGSDYVTAENGVITAKAAGTATVTVTYYDTDDTTVLASVTITVTVTDNRTATQEPGETVTETGITLTEGYADEVNSYFANPSDGSLTAETATDENGNVTITVAGTASTMSAEEANDFWAGHAQADDAYIVVTVTFQQGETVTWTRSDGTQGNVSYDDDHPGTFEVVIRISGADIGTEIGQGKATFTISDGTNTTTYTVDFSGVTPSGEVEEGKTEYALTGTYDAETGAWTYTDGSNTFSSLDEIEGTIVSITLTASDVDSFTAACAWNEEIEIVPVITVTENITMASKISVSGCEKVIVLNADITLTADNDVTTLGIYTDVTIDLNGHNIARAEGYTGTVGTIRVDGSTTLGCGNLTIKDSVGTGTVSGTYALGIFSTTATTGETSFTLVSGTITGSYAAIASNGTYPLVTINIYGGTVTSTGETNPAIFLPSGTLNLYGGTVTGATGIEVRGGVANIYGGTITATGTPGENVDETTSNGPVASGYAIAQTWNSSYPENGAVNISGTAVIVGSIYAAGDNVARISITGGTFSVDPSVYLGEGYEATAITEGDNAEYYVVAEKTDGENDGEITEEQWETVVEVNFDGDSFTSGQTFVSQYTTEGESGSATKIAPGDGKIVTSTGEETGFIGKGTADDAKAIVTGTKNTNDTGSNVSHTVLVFDGTGSSTKNSVAYTLQAGTYTVKISYFSASKNGRYATIYTDSGELEEAKTVSDDEKTKGDTEANGGTGINEILTREITFTIEEETTIYIGSADSGLYVTFIGIYQLVSGEDISD